MLSSYKKIAKKYFSWVSRKYPEVLKTVESTIPKSGISMSPDNYISCIFLTVIIGYFISLSAVAIMLSVLFQFNILVSILLIVFIPFITGVLIFIVGVFYPYQRVAGRGQNIETNLPFALSHMGAIASSGVPPTAIFKLLSEFKEYGVLAEEMEKIVRNIDVFGLDPVSAMREVAKRTPSERFKQLLAGIASTIEGGGNLKTYLKNAGEQSLFTWRTRREKYLQRLSAYAEFYTGLLIAAPLFLISLFSVMNMIQPQLGGYNILDLMRISIYLIVPALNLFFVAFLHMTQVEM
jgi:flagellar protein FlaJ